MNDQIQRMKNIIEEEYDKDGKAVGEIKDIVGNVIQVGDMILYPWAEGEGGFCILKRGIVVFINYQQNNVWFFVENNFDGMPLIATEEVARKSLYVMKRIKMDA